MRVGWGIDAHRFAATGRVLLAGVVADPSRGVSATSDGDVAAHAVIDALLGAAALGDIGTHFPPGDTASQDADSMDMLDKTARMLGEAGFTVDSIDLTVVSQSVRVDSIRESVREALSDRLEIPIESVSVKATTTDGMGFTGRDEGLAAFAVAVVSVEGG